MAKRKKYYQGKKDRMNESRGMKRVLRNMDEGMISEDKNAFAYLPQEVMSKKYPDMMEDSMYYEQGRAYQDRCMDKMARMAKKEKMDGHGYNG